LTHLNSPEYLPIEFDYPSNQVKIAKMNESDYQKSIFILSKGEGRGFLHYQDIFEYSLSEFLSQNSQDRKEPYFIFHHGFCCSTLLSRLIEGRFQTLSLREPPGINWATHFKKNSSDWTKEKQDLFLGLKYLHGRTFTSNQRAIVKCSDYVSYQLTDFLNQNTKSIFLYSNLEEFIASCSKEQRDIWIANRANYEELKNSLGYQNEIDINDTPTQATLYWCMQIAKFLENPYPGNSFSLNMTRIFSERNLMKTIGDFFKLKERYLFSKNRNLNEIMSSYSKTGDYDYSFEKRMSIINKILQDKNIYTQYYTDLAKDILGNKLLQLKETAL
jgi:hypothetical protein